MKLINAHTITLRRFISTVSFSFPYTAPSNIYTLSLHDALPIYGVLFGLEERAKAHRHRGEAVVDHDHFVRSEEHTSELQSRPHLVCRLLLERKNSGRPVRGKVVIVWYVLLDSLSLSNSDVGEVC